MQPAARPTSRRTTVWRLSVPIVCLAVHGCTEASGGAVELSWALRSTQDREITDCAEGRIRDIQLWWESDAVVDAQSFPCDASHGTTAFEVPPGPVTLRVQPTCDFVTGPQCAASPVPCECASNPADSATFEAPPPLVRHAVVGETITLDAVVIVIDAARVCRLDLLCPAP